MISHCYSSRNFEEFWGNLYLISFFIADYKIVWLALYLGLRQHIRKDSGCLVCRVIYLPKSDKGCAACTVQSWKIAVKTIVMNQVKVPEIRRRGGHLTTSSIPNKTEYSIDHSNMIKPLRLLPLLYLTIIGLLYILVNIELYSNI